MPTEHFNILGTSEATLSYIFESIAACSYKNATVTIIKNIDYTPKLPFAIEGLAHEIVADKDIDFSNIKNCLIGVHRCVVKKQVFDYFKKNHGVTSNKYTNIISPNSVIYSTSTLGVGINISDHVVLSAYSHIENFVTISKGTIIGHHTHVGDFCTMNQGVQIAGNCRIGEGTLFGMGAHIVDGITIGKNSVIGACSLVTKDIPEGVVAYGIPAKIIRPAIS
ncbi:MAG: hypothetical protein R3E32_18185 [Chitinophagales bacterium]